MKPRIFVPAVVLLCGVFLAACSSSGDHSGMNMGGANETMPMGDSPASSIAASADFNSTDVGFAQGMIPHHAQAIEMADMAIATSTNADVLALAKQIKAAQDPEIEQMTSWLKSWGQKVPGMTMSGTHDMTGMNDMMTDGMMSEMDMTKLAQSTGPSFDRLWLEMMVLHHQGAVTMAKAELVDGKNSGAKTLAQNIITGQQTEIDKMNALVSSMPS